VDTFFHYIYDITIDLFLPTAKITPLTITNFLGQAVRTQTFNAEQAQETVAAWPAESIL